MQCDRGFINKIRVITEKSVASYNNLDIIKYTKYAVTHKTMELSLEQQFSLRQYEEQIARMNETQAKELLHTVIRSHMVQEAAIKDLIRQIAQVDTTTSFSRK